MKRKGRRAEGVRPGSLVTLAGLCLAAQVFSATPEKRFQRACPVYAAPTLDAKVLCEKKAGVPVRAIRSLSGDFASVETESCNGFIYSDCLGLPKESPAAPGSHPAGSERAGVAISPALPSGITLGLAIGGNGNFGHPPSGDNTNGFAYAVEARLTFPMGDRFRLVAAAGYEVMSLSRTIDGTGSLPAPGSSSGGAGLIDPDPAQFTQQIRYAALGGYLGWKPLGEGGAGSRVGSVEWWLEGGFDFLYPISALQSDNFNDQQSFASQDKVLFGVLGLSGEVPINARLVAGANLQGAYNLGSDPGNQLFSVRLNAFLQMRL